MTESAGFNSIPTSKAKEYLRKADTDNNGKVSYQEMQNYWTSIKDASENTFESGEKAFIQCIATGYDSNIGISLMHNFNQVFDAFANASTEQLPVVRTFMVVPDKEIDIEKDLDELAGKDSDATSITYDDIKTAISDRYWPIRTALGWHHPIDDVKDHTENILNGAENYLSNDMFS